MLRLIVALVLTGLLLVVSRPAAVLDAVAGASWSWLAASFGLMLLDRVVMAWRWVRLLEAIEPRARSRVATLLHVFFVSTYLGAFLPTSVGSDALRMVALGRHDLSRAAGVVSVLMDRVLGVLSILLMAGFGLLSSRDLARDPAVAVPLATGALGCLAVAALVFSPRMARLAQAAVDRIPIPIVRRLGSRTFPALQAYSRARGPLALVLAASVLVQVLRTLQAYAGGRALDIPLGVAPYFAVMPIILLVMLLPVNIGGLGAGQLAYVGLFGRVGVSVTDAFTLSIVLVALALVANLPGGVLYVMFGVDGPGQPPADAAAEPRSKN